MAARIFPKKLGVNIDHVATLRQARRGCEPSVCRAALEAESAGADGITIHLREDRRHIQDFDLKEIRRAIHVPLNLEMAFVPEMIETALAAKPGKICLVPERRRELTTEGGLDARAIEQKLKKAMPSFRRAGIEVSLFIDPDTAQIHSAKCAGADAVEFHTGTYAHARGGAQRKQRLRIARAAQLAASLGLKVNAGHGLDYENIKALARIPQIEEFNIGHSIVSRAVFTGLARAVRDMKRLITGRGR